MITNILYDNKDQMKHHKLGTNYGRWYVPDKMKLNEKSIIYSGGVGEDISFDLALQSKYNCNILLIDPTEKAIKHYAEVKSYYNDNQLFTGGIQKDYYRCIENLKPDLSKFDYMNIGLWNKKDELRFYKQTNKNYVSQSLIENMFGTEYDTVRVDTISNIMKHHNHDRIDLLKLDIEGAEIKVVNQMFDDGIFPVYLLIEFDLHLKKKDINKDTDKLINRIKQNYKLIINDNYNITFERNF